jgi:hypothetical protein
MRLDIKRVDIIFLINMSSHVDVIDFYRVAYKENWIETCTNF